MGCGTVDRGRQNSGRTSPRPDGDLVALLAVGVALVVSLKGVFALRRPPGAGTATHAELLPAALRGVYESMATGEGFGLPRGTPPFRCSSGAVSRGRSGSARADCAPLSPRQSLPSRALPASTGRPLPRRHVAGLPSPGRPRTRPRASRPSEIRHRGRHRRGRAVRHRHFPQFGRRAGCRCRGCRGLGARRRVTRNRPVTVSVSQRCWALSRLERCSG